LAAPARRTQREQGNHKVHILRGGMIAFTATLLVGALAFLYFQTQGIDPGQQTEIAGMLRRLKDIDTRWDIEVLRGQSEVQTAPPLSARPAADIQRVQFTLETQLRQLGDGFLVQRFEGVKAALAEKAQLVRALEQTNADATRALDSALRCLGAVHAAGGEASAAANVLKSALIAFRVAPGGAPRQQVDEALAQLQGLAPTLPAAVQEQVPLIEADARSFLERRAEEATSVANLLLVTAGPLLDSFTDDVERRFTFAAQKKDLYRVYLLSYTAALLLLLGYLGARLLGSYRTIGEMNRALKAAKDTLELRVDERTRELTAALSKLKESEAQLIQSEKMSSLGQMVAGVAHEINTPLAYVKNSLGAVSDRLPELQVALEDANSLLQMLQDGSPNEDALHEQFTRTASQVSRLRQGRIIADLRGLSTDGLHGIEQISELVHNLRNFSRLDRSQVTTFDVNEGLASSLALARHLLKSIEVRRELGKVPPIRCSPSQINQIFLNLITNAAQAANHAHAVIVVRSRRDGTDRVAVDVEDNGSGIAPEVLPKIFDPFFTTKEIGKGTGLGLSIAYKIVQQHGGRIDVTSTPGKGTRFTVVLPIASSEAVGLAA
jgi:two-component system NtrC family sensor kinase